MLERCPRCDYPLTGLPADHACPECGLRYDRGSRLYVQRYDPLLYVAPNAFVAFYMLHMLNVVSGTTGFLRMALFCAWFLVAGGVVFSSFYLYRLSRRRRMLCALADGMLIKHRNLRTQFISWSDISRVQAARASLGATVSIKSSRTVENLTGYFQSKAEVAEFVAYAGQKLSGDLAPMQGNLSPSASPDTVMDAAALREEPALAEVPLPGAREWRDLPTAGMVMSLVLAGLMCGMLGVFWLRTGLLAAAVLVWAGSFVWKQLGPKTPQRIIVSAGGIRILRGAEEVFSSRWADFARVEASRTLKTILVRGRHGAILFQLPGSYPLHWRQLHAAAESIQQRGEAHWSPPQ